MSLNFADCYQSVTFGHDRELQAIREESAKIAAESLTDNIALELVKFVYGGVPAPEKIEEFRKFFKDKDPSFKTSGNDEELVTLAGWVLAEICSKKISPVTIAILTSAVGGARKPSIGIDLVGIAEYETSRDCECERKRPEIVFPTHFEKVTFEDHCKKEGEEEAEEEEEAELDTSDLKSTITSILAQLDEKQKEYIQFAEDLHKVVSIQDEELQILWWLIGGWSERWGMLFDAIDAKSRPILLANELAGLSMLPVEPRSLRSIFARVKIGDLPLTIPEVVAACGTSHMSKVSSTHTPCPIITPILFAIHRAAEIDGDAAWVPAWEKLSGISPEHALPAIELAVQCFREYKLLEQLNSAKD